MYSILTLATIGSAALAAAMPYQVSIVAADDSPITPSWAKEDKQRLIQISDKARTGLVDPVIEEGLFSVVGPRFGNVFYENVSDSSATGFQCFTQCPATIVRAVPCLYSAISSGHIEQVLTCVSKSDLCNCADCLPDALTKVVVDQICSKSSVVDIAAADRFSPYVDFQSLASSSLSLAAFRGDIYNYQLEELKTLNKLHNQSLNKLDGDVHTMCWFGTSCGKCDCCVGLCAGSVCVGGCA